MCERCWCVISRMLWWVFDGQRGVRCIVLVWKGQVTLEISRILNRLNLPPKFSLVDWCLCQQHFILSSSLHCVCSAMYRYEEVTWVYSDVFVFLIIQEERTHKHISLYCISLVCWWSRRPCRRVCRARARLWSSTQLYTAVLLQHMLRRRPGAMRVSSGVRAAYANLLLWIYGGSSCCREVNSTGGLVCLYTNSSSIFISSVLHKHSSVSPRTHWRSYGHILLVFVSLVFNYNTSVY